MTAPLVFCDTETTGLEPDAEIWEFAAIRREPDGTETELHLFIDHDPAKCRRLPESFLADHVARYPAHGRGAYVPRGAAIEISKFIAGPEDADKAHIVGAVPNFDTERLARLLDGWAIPWHYHLIDVENLAVGALAAQPLRVMTGMPAPDTAELRNQLNKVVWAPPEGPEFHRGNIAPPWDSEDLSRAIGVDPDQFERHTAMGDARWARAIYDRIMGHEEGDDA